MKIILTTLLLLAIFETSWGDQLAIGMPLDSARVVLEAAGAKEDLNAYHFPWTSRFVEVKFQDGETYEESMKRIDAELKKLTGPHGYSVFFILKDKTRLELVLEVDGESRRIRRIRLGEDQKEYRDKLDWIDADDEHKLRERKSLDLKRQPDESGQPVTRAESRSEGGDRPQPESGGRSR